MSHPALRPLSAAEARVLATLMEKARTVPDSYPLTLNSLVAGCNQKTARDPVTELAEGEVQDALDALRRLSLVVEISGGRVSRWEHNAKRVLGLPDQSLALLGLLLLRGPQTAGELRINSERWHRFADISSVEAFLDELAQRPQDKGGPLVLLLPRAPGEREPRWAQLLTGPVDTTALAAAAAAPAAGPSPAGSALQARVETLEAEVARLRAQLEEVCAALGLSPHGQAK